MNHQAKKIQKVLSDLGLKCEVVELPESTRTAAEAAVALKVEVGQIVKALIFKTKNTDSGPTFAEAMAGRQARMTGGKPVLVIASGKNRVDEEKVGLLLGETIERADADFVRDHTGFAIGGIPPVGLKEVMATFFDEDLLSYEFGQAAAGTHNAVFKVNTADLLRITGGIVAEIKQPVK